MNKIEVLLIDVGNTLVKISPVINGVIQESSFYESLEKGFINSSDSAPVIISSTRDLPKNLISKEKEQRQVIEVSTKLKLPITLNYRTPETLGADRLAAAVGASVLFPGEHCVLLDIGTCLTMDLLSSGKVFEGGAISPGLKMRFKSMHYYTSKLPDLSETWQNENENELGSSTAECLRNGVIKGITSELNAFIEGVSGKFATLNIILSGGDAQFFESRIKASIFARSKIVQEGLYCLWKYNK